jgi:hypothetical protein
MNTETRSPRVKLIREAAVLQIKLLADGFRDAVLIPVSLIAALIGLLRGGDEPDREYRRVIKLGRRSERWIDLFGHQRPLGKSHPVGSMDDVLGQMESAMIKHYKKEQTGKEQTGTKEHKSDEQDSDTL